MDAVALAQTLDGMFAFAVWDRPASGSLLGRDRVGKKPLYYWSDGATLVFASEIKGVLAHPAVPCELDERALSAYLTFGYVPTPDTFFAGDQEPAAGARADARARRRPADRALLGARRSRASMAARRPSLDLGLDEAARRGARVSSSGRFERRLIADVPLGAFLSGGIDSSAIVALMAGVIGRAGEDVHDRLRGPGRVRRAAVRARGGDALRHRAPRGGRPPRGGRAGRAARVAPRPAVRRLERDPDLPAQRGGPARASPWRCPATAATSCSPATSGSPPGVAVDRLRLRPAGRVRRGGARSVGALPASAFRGRAGSAQRFAAAVEHGMPWAYLSWISYVPDGQRRRLLPTRRRLGAGGLRAAVARDRGRRHAGPTAGAQI